MGPRALNEARGRAATPGPCERFHADPPALEIASPYVRGRLDGRITGDFAPTPPVRKQHDRIRLPHGEQQGATDDTSTSACGCGTCRRSPSLFRRSTHRKRVLLGYVNRTPPHRRKLTVTSGNL